MLLCSFGGKITPNVKGDKSVEYNDYLLLNFNLFLGWLTRRDVIDMWFKLELIKGSK